MTCEVADKPNICDGSGELDPTRLHDLHLPLNGTILTEGRDTSSKKTLTAEVINWEVVWEDVILCEQCLHIISWGKLCFSLSIH